MACGLPADNRVDFQPFMPLFIIHLFDPKNAFLEEADGLSKTSRKAPGWVLFPAREDLADRDAA